MAKPGWGRSAIAYGPFARTPGLAFAVKVDNGHSLSQSYQLKNWVRQTARWLKGGETEPLPVRFTRWLGHRPRIALIRKVNRWFQSRESAHSPPPVIENFAAGFYPHAAPSDPVSSGNGIVIHASRVFNNGELWARVGPKCASTCTSLQNLTIYYIVVLRERGAIYYAAALPGSHAVGGYPHLRPIAIDPVNADPEVFASVSQAVLGEIGFTMDTVVHGVKIAQLGKGFGSAHVFDRLRGSGDLHATSRWEGCGIERTSTGARAASAKAVALQFPPQPTGLVHAVLHTAPNSSAAGLVFRARDAAHFWAVLANDKGCRVCLVENGVWTTVAEGIPALNTSTPNSIQVVDHGPEFTVSINGEMATGRRFIDSRLSDGLGVGVCGSPEPGSSSDIVLSDFEAHPREIPIPPLLDMGPPAMIEATTITVRDDFSGPQGDLEGHTTTLGNKVWRHDFGAGRFEITGESAARVVASRGVPSPGRTFYTIPWESPDLADIDLEMTPPGTKRGEGQRGRGGMIFMQDARNYFMVNLWLHDNLETASISTFFRINGFDDLYDAIWTCTGPDRTVWGVPFRFRSAFDGNRFLVRINGEPVLQRSLTDVYPRQSPLMVNRIGLFTNWEWGTDTGTVFKDFIARGR